ncbi:MAG: hypothetical protein WD076_06385, partial [Parvularculaceae bacterium]
EVRAAVDRNYEAFTAKLAQLIERHRGKFALMRDGEVVEMFTTLRDAHMAAKRRYSDDLYSIQEITDAPVDLTYLCRVLDTRST